MPPSGRRPSAQYAMTRGGLAGAASLAGAAPLADGESGALMRELRKIVREGGEVATDDVIRSIAALAPPPRSARAADVKGEPRYASAAGALRTPRAVSAITAASAAAAALDSGSGPLSPRSALREYADAMTPYELTEMAQYPRIYYVGAGARKVQGTTNPGSNNHGYDDAQGDYKLVLKDHIAYRYEVLQPLGRGSFGQVVKALDHRTGAQVAVKVIKNKRKFHEQAMVEVNVLKHMRDCDPMGSQAVLRLIDSFTFRSHAIIVCELYGPSLYDLMKQTRFAPMPRATVRMYARQMAGALAFSASERIVHCDLKPENVLVGAVDRTSLRVIDFGSACFQHQRLYTYIQSRFYRAPEIVLGIPYTTAIDVWSLGCVIAELCNGYPLFPAESESHLVGLIASVRGLPLATLLESSPRRANFFDAAGHLRGAVGAKGQPVKVHGVASQSLAAFMRTDDRDMLDFVERCLTWDPRVRMTAADALRHPFIADAAVAASTVLGVESKVPRTTRVPSAAAYRYSMPAPPAAAAGPSGATSARTTSMLPRIPTHAAVTTARPRA
jgi:serine/threonine protein kinase